ncbi:hypothetical protein AMTRI_Chr04g183680 [Amborella trichopoda]
MVAGCYSFLPILAHLSFFFLYPRPRASNFLRLAAPPPATHLSPSFFNCFSTLRRHFFPPLPPRLGCCPVCRSLSPILTETPLQPIALSLSKVFATLTHAATFCSLSFTLKANHTGLLSTSSCPL